jgi:hypothetical protein
MSAQCLAKHPSNDSVIPCQLLAGHKDNHFSTSGCAGGGFVWPRERGDALDRVRRLLAEWDQPFEKDSTTFGVKYVKGWDSGLIQCREELRAALNEEATPEQATDEQRTQRLSEIYDVGRPPLELPTEPTWGIAVGRFSGGVLGKWCSDGERVGSATELWSNTDVLDFIPLTDEQVKRIEGAR